MQRAGRSGGTERATRIATTARGQPAAAVLEGVSAVAVTEGGSAAALPERTPAASVLEGAPAAVPEGHPVAAVLEPPVEINVGEDAMQEPGMEQVAPDVSGTKSKQWEDQMLPAMRRCSQVAPAVVPVV